MKTFLVVIFVVCTALPFAFYVCCAASNGKSVPPGFIKAFGMLLMAVFAFALASLDSIESIDALATRLRSVTRWKFW